MVRLLFFAFLFLITVQWGSNAIFASVAVFMITIFENSQFLVDSTIVSTHGSIAKYSAMYTTMMASLSNFGRNTSLQLKLIGIVGYGWGTTFGLLYLGIVVIIWRRVSEWVVLG